MKLIYLNIGLSSVFDSQVLELLETYERSRKFEDIILLYGWRDQSEIIMIKKKFEQNSIRLVFFKTYPSFPVISWLTINSMASKLLDISNVEDYTIHVRGEVLGYYLHKAYKLIGCKITKLLVDVRGASIEEIQIYASLPAIFKKIKVLLNMKALYYLRNNRAKMSVVSQALKDYLIAKGFMEEDVMISHCLAGKKFYFDPEKRVRVRKELNLSDDDVCIVFSSGSSANWQNSEVINDLINSNDKMKILNLSRKQINHNRVINRFVPYKEMTGYLCAADYGLIIRDDNIVNNVACPVKLVEYYSCGLPVIHNDTIALIRNYDFLSAKSTTMDEITGLDLHAFDIDRCQLSNVALSLFGIDRISSIYRQTYSVL
ncbi:MAG: hypothetical protein K9J13_00595 [Saprospiraceae bacterium]|nr:hypothetical protein [Saprospiraceae bacterium]